MESPEKQSFQRKIWEWIKIAIFTILSLGSFLYFKKRLDEEKGRREALEALIERRRTEMEERRKIEAIDKVKAIEEAKTHAANLAMADAYKKRAEEAAEKGPHSLVVEIEERAKEGRLTKEYLDEIEKFLRGE